MEKNDKIILSIVATLSLILVTIFFISADQYDIQHLLYGIQNLFVPHIPLLWYLVPLAFIALMVFVLIKTKKLNPIKWRLVFFYGIISAILSNIYSSSMGCNVFSLSPQGGLNQCGLIQTFHSSFLSLWILIYVYGFAVLVTIKNSFFRDFFKFNGNRDL